MKEKLIKTLDLKNGLQLKIYDASRSMVGDRWLVRLIARMTIPVNSVLDRNDTPPKENADQIKGMLGECVVFEQKREKIFVDATEKENVFKSLCDVFLDSSLNYLSKKRFPENYILKKYKEQRNKASLFRADINTG